MKKAIVFFVLLIVMFLGYFLSHTLLANQTSVSNKSSNNTLKETKKVHFLHWSYFPKELFNDFKTKNPNLSVEFEKINENNYDKLLKTTIASGSQVDVIGLKGNVYEDFVRRGYLVDLSDRTFLNNYKTDIRADVRSILKNGREYAVAYKGSVFGIWYNKILFDKYDIRVPDNYNEFIDVCRKLKVNGINPMVIGARDDWAGSCLFLLRFLNVTDQNKLWFQEIMSGKMKWTDMEISSAFQDIGSFINEGYLSEDSINLTYQQAFNEFINGHAAMTIMGDSSINLIKGNVERVCEPGVFPIPYKNSGWTNKVAGSKTDFLIGIFNESKLKGGAESLLDYLSTPEAAKIYSDITLSFPTIKGVDTSNLNYSRVWEPLRKTELISSGIYDMDEETRNQFYYKTKEMIAGTKTFEQILKELQSFQENIPTGVN